MIEYLQKKYSNQLNFNQTNSLNNTAYGLLFCSLATNKSLDKEFLQTVITSSKYLDGLYHCGENPIAINLLITFENNVRISPLINAIVHDNFQLVKFLLELGVDVNFPDEEKRTPLMHAVRQVNFFYIIEKT